MKFFIYFMHNMFHCSDWSALEAELAELVEGVIQEMMEPEKNNLIPRAD